MDVEQKFTVIILEYPKYKDVVLVFKQIDIPKQTT